MTAPPKRRSGPAVSDRAASTSPNAGDQSSHETRCQRCRRGLRAPLSVARSHGPTCWHRRADAAVRLPRLDCGCRDPWACRCGTVPALSDSQLDGWADAARYVMDTTGCTPMLPVDVLRGLWRRGGDDRALAEKLRAAGGAVA